MQKTVLAREISTTRAFIQSWRLTVILTYRSPARIQRTAAITILKVRDGFRSNFGPIDRYEETDQTRYRPSQATITAIDAPLT
jgi:hypothetical protein